MAKPICIVTGVGEGTGAALVRRFARGGYQVAMIARNTERLDALQLEVADCLNDMAAHSVIASMQKVPADVIQAIRNDKPIADEKLEALRTFAATLIEKRGWLSDDDIAAFRSASSSQAQVLEVVLAASLKTLSNYANHLTETPLDDAFSNRAWQPLKRPAA